MSNGHPPRMRSGFDKANEFETCPDCNLRGALSRTTLHPQHDHDEYRRKALKEGRVVGIRFSATTVDACETCKGTGEVPRGRKGDPYDRDALLPPGYVTPRSTRN